MCSRYGIDQYTANWLRLYFHHEEEQAVGDVPCDSLSSEGTTKRQPGMFAWLPFLLFGFPQGAARLADSM